MATMQPNSLSRTRLRCLKTSFARPFLEAAGWDPSQYQLHRPRSPHEACQPDALMTAIAVGFTLAAAWEVPKVATPPDAGALNTFAPSSRFGRPLTGHFIFFQDMRFLCV